MTLTKITLPLASLFFLLNLFCLPGYAQSSDLSTLFTPSVLPVASAFDVSLSVEENTLNVHWHIAPSTYLYQNSLKLDAYTQQGSEAALLTEALLPTPQEIDDPYFGIQKLYRDSFHTSVPVPATLLDETLFLRVHYQGCAESGFCYPPITQWYELNHAHSDYQITPLPKAPTFLKTQETASNDDVTQKSYRFEIPQASRFFNTLKEQHVVTTIALFYFIGILLTFTPCVLPMIPILLSVIVGQKHLNTRKAFWLSLSYVLTMAFSYALLGVLAATLGKNLQAALQHPAVIISFAAVFVYLGLSQAGILRINVAQGLRLQDLLTKLHAKQESGTYLGAAIMGFLASLISSPCITAPLIGALSYISQSGNVFFGGGALLAMGLGMGTLLLVVGTLGGKFVPQSGPWMHEVNYIFAIMMFGLSLWILDRLYHGPWLLLLWGALCLFAAWRMKTFTPKAPWSGRVGVLLVLYAGWLFWGAVQGKSDVLKPLTANPWYEEKQHSTHEFQVIHSLEGLNKVSTSAKSAHQPLMLVFYAQWCIACRHMEKNLFEDPSITKAIQHWQIVQADVTDYNEGSQRLLQKFDLIGPPAILFFDQNGTELKNYRLFGEVSKAQFQETWKKIEAELAPSPPKLHLSS